MSEEYVDEFDELIFLLIGQFINVGWSDRIKGRLLHLLFEHAGDFRTYYMKYCEELEKDVDT